MSTDQDSSKKSRLSKPEVSSASQKELDKCEEQFNAFDEHVKSLTHDRLNELAPREHDAEMQHKMSQREMQRANAIVLKPSKSIGSKEPFNEKFRDEYKFKSQYVKFVAEHREIIGEKIETWTKPFAGMPAEFWEVPVNKPVIAPRYVAERIKKCGYHRLKMDERTSDQGQGMTFYGSIAVDNYVQRLEAHPVNEAKSIFLGAEGF